MKRYHLELLLSTQEKEDVVTGPDADLLRPDREQVLRIIVRGEVNGNLAVREFALRYV